MFLLYDYYLYRNNLKHYSYEYLQVEYDLKKCTDQNFIDRRNTIPVSFVFYHGKKSLLSWVIMYLTDSPISHVATFAKNGELVDCLLDEGVCLTHIDDYIDGISCMRIVELSDSQLETFSVWQMNGMQIMMAIIQTVAKEKKQSTREEIIEKMKEKIGAPYNFWGLSGYIIPIMGGVGSFRWRLFFDCLIVYVLLILIFIQLNASIYFVLVPLVLHFFHIIFFLPYSLLKPPPGELFRQALELKKIESYTDDDFDRDIMKKVMESESWLSRRVSKSKF